jgi:hypothetical protein
MKDQPMMTSRDMIFRTSRRAILSVLAAFPMLLALPALAQTEWAYDRASSIGKLDKALDTAQAMGWTVVDMKNDWNKIFPFGSK